MIDPYTPEARKADTLKHIKHMADRNALDRISVPHLADAYHGMTEAQIEAAMVKHMPEGGEGK